MMTRHTVALLLNIAVLTIADKNEKSLSLRGASHSHYVGGNMMLGDVQVSRFLSEDDTDDYYDDDRKDDDEEHEDGNDGGEDGEYFKNDDDDTDDYYDDDEVDNGEEDENENNDKEEDDYYLKNDDDNTDDYYDDGKEDDGEEYENDDGEDENDNNNGDYYDDKIDDEDDDNHGDDDNNDDDYYDDEKIDEDDRSETASADKLLVEIKKGSDETDVQDLLNQTERRCYLVGPPKVGMAMNDVEHRPIWIAQFQETLSKSLQGRLIGTLTGMDSGAKNFYASSSGLKHCIKSNDPGSTVTCTVLADDGPMQRSFADRFETSVYIMPLRNPMTSLPFAANYKAIMYHGQVGQMPSSGWQSLRDRWFDDMMERWVGGIIDWDDDTVYRRAIYIAYEDMMSPQRGPKVVKELSVELSRLGFPGLLSDDDAECAWYNIVGGQETLRPYHSSGQYEYDEYRPGFTEEQKKKMILTLDDLVLRRDFASSGGRIKEILVDYIHDIRENMVVDTLGA